MAVAYRAGYLFTAAAAGARLAYPGAADGKGGVARQPLDVRPSMYQRARPLAERLGRVIASRLDCSSETLTGRLVVGAAHIDATAAVKGLRDERRPDDGHAP